MKLLAPSILAGNHANLVNALELAEGDGRKWIHLDIMDGHFVPNLSFGPQTVSDLRKKSQMFFDVHLMLERPDLYIDPFIEAGSNLITIHTEPNYDQKSSLDKIRAAGLKTGMAINPETPIDGLLPFLGELDLVLLMTVHPGFGGQRFIEEVLEKVKEISRLRSENQHDFVIEVDGGVGPEHVPTCLDAGVDIFVAGTAYYKLDDAGRRTFAQSVGESKE
ncbi:MAG: ribulose-phosphate 3-epimerase [Verrucomicrobiota bacterium]|nr:ribulose-phosphate 3-epimerase [Verrucomicrobiota bacterium]